MALFISGFLTVLILPSELRRGFTIEHIEHNKHIQYIELWLYRISGYPAFFISGIRPDIRFHLRDIRLAG